MNDRSATSKFARGAVAAALCYILVLQTFLVNCSVAVANSPVSAGAVICHSGGGNAPDNHSDKRTPASDACGLCAVCTLAACQDGLPAHATTVETPRTVSRLVRPFKIADLAKPRPLRAGFARAPPKFA
jgi:hypothetical protein